MKRNTYVTAALFVVFGLLTVIYMNMGVGDYEDSALTSGISSVHPNDVATIGDVNTDDADSQATDEEGSDNEDAGAVADATDETTENEDEDCCDVISLLDSLRSAMSDDHTAQVLALTEIIASADFSAETKSAAKDSLNDLNALANSSRVLETMINHRGFEDALVRASADFVQVTVQVSSLADVPTREELAELYIMAGIQFAGHRNGNISIDFQPLN